MHSCSFLSWRKMENVYSYKCQRNEHHHLKTPLTIKSFPLNLPLHTFAFPSPSHDTSSARTSRARTQSRRCLWPFYEVLKIVSTIPLQYVIELPTKGYNQIRTLQKPAQTVIYLQNGNRKTFVRSPLLYALPSMDSVASAAIFLEPYTSLRKIMT